MKLWLQVNDIESYSIHNEGRSATERFISTPRNQIYKHVIVVSKKFILIS